MNIAIVEPISSGAALVIAAKELGHDVYVISFNDADRTLPQIVKDTATEIIEFETNDDSLFVQQVTALHTKVKLDAIISGNEYYVPITAVAANKIGVKGIPPTTVENLRFKHKMRQCLAEAGLATPRFHIIRSVEDIEALHTEGLFPCVLKPLGAAGSVHVKKVTSINELTQAYLAAQEDTRSELGFAIGNDMLLEGYLDGEEFSVDGFVLNDEVHVVSVTKKLLEKEPYFVEIGHIVPADIDDEKRQTITNYIAQCAKALGLNLGAFHGEIRFTSTGPVLIEIGARLPGDKIVDLVRLSSGIDLAKTTILLYLDMLTEVPENLQLGVSAITFFADEKLAQLSGYSGEEQLQSLDGYVSHQFMKKIGDAIPPLTDYRGRLAFAVFHHKERTQLLQSLSQAQQVIELY